MKKTEKNKSKRKKALISVGLSMGLLGIIGTGALAANYVSEKNFKKDIVLNENVVEIDKVEGGKEEGSKVEKPKVELPSGENIIQKPKIDEKKENNNKNEVINKEPVKEQIKEDIEEENKESVQAPIKTNGSNINNAAKSYAVNRFDVEKMVKGTYDGPLKDEKMVFLTFDDGPSQNTGKVLDILNRYKVHGTFFTIGNLAEKNPDYIKRIYNEGNALGNHTYSHDFSKIYPGNKISVNNYMDEYDKTEKVLKNILGDNFNSQLVRMPGGENSREYYKDPNLSVLRSAFRKESIASVDWNSLNGDAEGKKYSVQEMIDYAKRSSKGKNQAVVLMHDAAAKGLTVEALPGIIEYFKSEGYSFKVIS
ncbi:MAG: polysaccharide deacetylase family protein [Sarcina sp.]